MGTFSCYPYRCGYGQEKIPQQGQSDADRADHDVLPRGLEGAAMPVEVNQRGACQRGGLDGHPEHPEVLAYGHQRHHSQENQQAAGEGALSGVGEQGALLEVLPPAPVFSAKVAQGVNRDHQKERTGNAQKKQAERIEKQPAIQNAGRPVYPGQGGQYGMARGGRQEQRPSRTCERESEGYQTCHDR